MLQGVIVGDRLIVEMNLKTLCVLISHEKDRIV